MKSPDRLPASSSRFNEAVKAVFGAEGESGEGAREWPHEDYALAAQACGKDRTGVEKLRRLCEDLESAISLASGPGTLCRAAGVPIGVFAEIDGRCWREVLTDEKLARLVWIGFRNFALALRGRDMDSGTRRTGMVIHAVAVARLEALGEREDDTERRQSDLLERRTLRQKTYLPRFVQSVLVLE